MERVSQGRRVRRAGTTGSEARLNTIYRRISATQLTVRCTRCDRGSRQKASTILEHQKFQCPSCGSLNDVDTGTLVQKISDAQARRDAQRSGGAPADSPPSQ